MVVTNIQIAKPAPVSRNKSNTENTNSFSVQKDTLPIDKIQFSRQTIIQPKLEIGKPGDRYEQEADSFADRVMMMPDVSAKAKIQTKPIAESISPLLQASFSGTSEDLVINSNLESNLNNSKNNGSSLPENTRTFMESRFRADFSDVKIHTDSNAVQMNGELNAHAFTHGNDIYFNSGKFNTESSSGKHLLAHELTHVVQQNGNIQRKAIVSNDQNNEKNILENALNVATAMANKAQQYMGGDNRDRYKLWYDNNFNPADNSTVARFNRVKNGWVKMYDVFKSKNVEFDCSTRNMNIYAQVYPHDKHYLIQIGKLFWGAPLSGRDSKGGTIVHEISHEEVYTNSAFNDFYGEANAKNFATNDPNSAVGNADNWEYFAEDSY